MAPHFHPSGPGANKTKRLVEPAPPFLGVSSLRQLIGEVFTFGVTDKRGGLSELKPGGLAAPPHLLFFFPNPTPPPPLHSPHLSDVAAVKDQLCITHTSGLSTWTDHSRRSGISGTAKTPTDDTWIPSACTPGSHGLHRMSSRARRPADPFPVTRVMPFTSFSQRGTSYSSGTDPEVCV